MEIALNGVIAALKQRKKRANEKIACAYGPATLKCMHASGLVGKVMLSRIF